jgi:hypothetical protein
VDSAAKVFPESLHLGQRVLISRAVGGCDAIVQSLQGLVGAALFCQGLRRHLEGGDVVRIVLDQRGELGEGCIDVALSKMRHGEAVAGKGIGGILFQYLGEEGNSVHGFDVLMMHRKLASCLKIYTGKT